MGKAPTELHLPDVEWEITRPFWEGCRDRVLRIPRCECGQYVWYPQPRCPQCRSRHIEWKPVSGQATLFTWTTVYRSFVPGHAARVPYMTGLVELVEHPKLRMATFLLGFEKVRPAIGAAVEVDFQPIEEGVMLPVFRRKSTA